MLTLPIRDTEAIAEASFGCWINALWGFVAVYNEKLEFIEHKEAFFILLRRLLEEERVVLFPPMEFWQQGKSYAPCRHLGGHENIWAISPKAMLAHLDKHWPVKSTEDINRWTLEPFFGGNTSPKMGRIASDTGQVIPEHWGLRTLWEQVMGELVKEHEMACEEVFFNQLSPLLVAGKVQLFPPTSLSTLGHDIRMHSQAHLSLNEAAKWRQCLSAFFLHPTCPLMGWVNADTGEAHPGPVKMWSLYEKTLEIHFYESCRRIFFERLLRWLEGGEGVLFAPSMYDSPGHWTVPYRKVRGFDVWAVSHEEIIDYMQAHWPKEVIDANDSALNDYWYSETCPQIGWIDEKTEEIVAS